MDAPETQSKLHQESGSALPIHGELPDTKAIAISSSTQGDAPSVLVDYDLYAHYLEDSDHSEEEKREVLQTLWNVICQFVAMGFGVHPMQLARNSCGQDHAAGKDSALSSQDAVKSKELQLTESFDRAGAATKTVGATGSCS